MGIIEVRRLQLELYFFSNRKVWALTKVAIANSFDDHLARRRGVVQRIYN